MIHDSHGDEDVSKVVYFGEMADIKILGRYYKYSHHHCKAFLVELRGRET